MLDEAFFVRDVKAGRKYWSLVAKRIFYYMLENMKILQYTNHVGEWESNV